MIYGGVPLYRRSSMIKNIKQELKDEYDIHLKSDVIKKVLELEEAEVMLGISRNMQMCYVWGTLYGVDAPPKRLAGINTQSPKIGKQHGYSMWKTGVPKFKSSKIAGMTDSRMPEEYFEMPEHKFTTDARQFRKNAGMDEIPEYKDLPEEKIKELCKKADDIELQNLTKAQQKRRLEKQKYNKLQNDFRHIIWDDCGYIPYGAYKENFTGKQRTIIDQLYDVNYNEIDTPDVRLEVIRRIIDVASQREVSEDYPQLFALEMQLEQECKEKGYHELPHYNIIEEYHGGRLKFYRNGKMLGTEKVEDLVRAYETAAWVQRDQRRDSAREKFRQQFQKELEENGVTFKEQVEKREFLGLADKAKGEKVRIVEENLIDAVSGLKCVDKDKGWKDTWILERADGTTSQNQERRSDIVMPNGDIYTKEGTIIVSEENMRKRRENQSKLGTQVKEYYLTPEERKALNEMLNAQDKCWDEKEYKKLLRPNVMKQTGNGDIVGNNWKDSGVKTDYEEAVYAARDVTDVQYEEWLNKKEEEEREREEQEKRDQEELRRLEESWDDEECESGENRDGDCKDCEDGEDYEDGDGDEAEDEDEEDYEEYMSEEELELLAEMRKRFKELKAKAKEKKVGGQIRKVSGSFDQYDEEKGYIVGVDVDEDGCVIQNDTEDAKDGEDGEGSEGVEGVEDVEEVEQTGQILKKVPKARTGSEIGTGNIQRLTGISNRTRPDKGQITGLDVFGREYVSDGVYSNPREEIRDRFEIYGTYDKYGNYRKRPNKSREKWQNKDAKIRYEEELQGKLSENRDIIRQAVKDNPYTEGKDSCYDSTNLRGQFVKGLYGSD